MTVVIQKEVPGHYPAVRSILLECFNTSAEADLVDALRRNGKSALSLTSQHGDIVTGHIMFSPVHILPASPAKGVGLAPLAVKPEYQHQGIGALLIREGLRLCRELEVDYIVVLGSPKVYSRFGFKKASSFGLMNEYGEDDAFMLLQIGSQLPSPGLVHYCPEFSSFSV